MKLDPRSKVLLLLFSNYLLLRRWIGLESVAFVALLLGLFWQAKRYRLVLIQSLIYAGMWGFDLYVFAHLSGKLASLLSMLLIGGRVLFPCFLAGQYLFMTSTASELMAAFRKWHWPEGLLITFAVMRRFFPCIRRDYRQIREALTLREGGLPFAKVAGSLRYFEYVMVPLLMSAGRVANELSIACLSKGLGRKGKKSSYIESRYGFVDYALASLLILVVVGLEVSVWL